ncbi:response regulator [Coraliomargarita akajimensis]|uniref:Response regulator receiver protein n=1 Tax=Coraliomargarita akajimensis (strain DSM 45221 / IAM 15411 / JCM 23193 / KCTC 12865 / 04OKA010-24) TaxID=583355 RepID=D5ELN4_CORAD|nr:response regulator [Coraliomargarita akajimensis]ADE53209.1 response regulator receiver protein [Coraliomargarita akajimensis DSM 45221]
MAKILLIEDAKTESLVVNKILKSIGHTVINAENGEDGLALAEKEQPDLVLSDIVMPKMDGFQVCRKIKRNKTMQHIPVILISSKSEETDKFWGLKQGASDYLNKPFDESDLVASIGNVLG